MKEFKQPWTYEYKNQCIEFGDSESFSEWFIINDKDGKQIVGELNEIEDEKLASLIAAAPELLEALQELLGSYENFMHHEFSSFEDEDACVIKARKSIAKALGEKNDTLRINNKNSARAS